MRLHCQSPFCIKFRRLIKRPTCFVLFDFMFDIGKVKKKTLILFLDLSISLYRPVSGVTYLSLSLSLLLFCQLIKIFVFLSVFLNSSNISLWSSFSPVLKITFCRSSYRHICFLYVIIHFNIALRCMSKASKQSLPCFEP